MKTAGTAFRKAFEGWARRIRARKLLRRTLSGAAFGLALGALLCAAAWALRLGSLRPWAALLGVVGALIGYALARRSAWSDGEIALYLDACLATDETITSALELSREAADHPAREGVLRKATEALETSRPHDARPRILERSHLALPLAAGALAYLVWIPLPSLPSPAIAPGSEQVKLAKVPGLEKIEQLAHLEARDPAQKERLQKLAEDAKRLREKLRQGVEKREAQAEIAKIRDAVTAERLSLGEGDRRAGFEAATARLAEEQALRDAAKALGDRDLKGFDEALERIANQREKKDRERAQKALEEAAELARKEGAEDVAKMLANAREQMKESEKRAELLRNLAEALGDRVKAELEELDREPGGESASKLADALGKALEQLSEEERARLAESLKRRLGDASLEPGSREALREYAEQLSSAEGLSELVEELRKLAREDVEGDEARRQQALEDAERFGAEAEGDITGRPVPIPLAGEGSKGAGNRGDGSDGSKGGQPGGGQGDDTGRGKHDGRTDAIADEGLTARARGRIDKRIPMKGVASGSSPGRPGETANVQGTGALRAVGPEELSGVERSEVPEEYREQVGRYFQP